METWHEKPSPLLLGHLQHVCVVLNICSSHLAQPVLDGLTSPNPTARLLEFLALGLQFRQAILHLEAAVPTKGWSQFTAQCVEETLQAPTGLTESYGPH